MARQCFGAKFPFWGYSCLSHVSLEHGVHKALVPTATLPASAWC